MISHTKLNTYPLTLDGNSESTVVYLVWAAAWNTHYNHMACEVTSDVH